MTIRVIPPDAKFENTVLITGFHGIGYAGYWTVKYLVQKLEAERIAFVDSETVSPVASTNQGRRSSISRRRTRILSQSFRVDYEVKLQGGFAHWWARCKLEN